MIDYKTPCPACRETFDNEGARQNHITACLEDGFDEYDIHIGLSVEEAVDRAVDVVETAVREFSDVALVWNGDKDSTALLHLIAETVGVDAVTVCIIDHGQHFKETEQYLEEQANLLGVTNRAIYANEDFLDQIVTDPPYVHDGGRPITWLPVRLLDEANQAEVERLVEDAPETDYREADDGGLEVPFYAGGEIGSALLRGIPMRRLCAEHDAVLTPLTKWDAYPERAAETASAFREAYFSRRDDPDHCRVHPLLDWREEFGWSFLGHPERNAEVHPLYHEGYEEIGPKPLVAPADAGGEVEGVDQGVMEHLRDMGYM